MANILIIFPPTGFSCAEQMDTVGSHLSEFRRKKHYMPGRDLSLLAVEEENGLLSRAGKCPEVSMVSVP